MTQLRYPADLPMTVEDFHACGWKEVLQEIAPDDFGYSALWTALSKAARSAMESDRRTHAKVLWLLADASSMMLRPSSLTAPFKPFAVFHDRRSALPEDFSEDDLSFFAELIEHIDHPLLKARLRTHLKQAGAMTTTLDAEGIETENGLSTLMALPETEDIFGKDLVFEFKALFCDPFGHNLRNELAHGLLDDGDCRSAASVYAWWLGLKLVFNTWWNSRAANAQDGDKVDKEGEGESHA